jgi:hypothetical protein
MIPKQLRFPKYVADQNTGSRRGIAEIIMEEIRKLIKPLPLK